MSSWSTSTPSNSSQPFSARGVNSLVWRRHRLPCCRTDRRTMGDFLVNEAPRYVILVRVVDLGNWALRADFHRNWQDKILWFECARCSVTTADPVVGRAGISVRLHLLWRSRALTSSSTSGGWSGWVIWQKTAKDCCMAWLSQSHVALKLVFW